MLILPKKKIAPPRRAGDATLIRRLSLDLVGLLPDADACRAFHGRPPRDKRATACPRAAGRRRAYADHWLTFWNDLLRNDYAGTGYIDGGRKQITGWLYRVARARTSPTTSSSAS